MEFEEGWDRMIGLVCLNNKDIQQKSKLTTIINHRYTKQYYQLSTILQQTNQTYNHGPLSTIDTTRIRYCLTITIETSGLGRRTLHRTCESSKPTGLGLQLALQLGTGRIGPGKSKTP